MRTFDTYEEAKAFGGDACIVLTTAREWIGGERYAGKFVATFIMCGGYFDVDDQDCCDGSYHMNAVSGWVVAENVPTFSDFSQNVECMTETDPNGINQHEAGAKLDNGKVIAASVLGMFANALYAVTEVGTFGANKYTEGGWQHVQDGEKRYANAGMRHFLKRNIGEEIDQDSELPHLAHEAWNKLAELELYLRSKKNG